MKLIDKIYKTLSHQLIWGPDGIMPLKKFKANSGGFTASCPNPTHEDTNPSFLMKEGLPTGKCQSCGYSLRWFDAIALSLGHKTTVKGKDYWKVIETLSSLNGGYHYELTTEEKERYELMHEIQELKNTLSGYLHQQLLENPWAEHTRQYLESRGIEKKYLSKLPMIGFYPQTETVEQYLISKKFSLEAIQEANVLFKYFQNQCLIFSYKDELGNTLGFKGRKPNTKVIRYQKGFKGEARNQAIMGLESCNAILENKHRIICVEGEFDWLKVQAEALKLQDGTAELVCFGGSDIKKEKLETLKKAGAEVLYLSFDPDIAGKKATRDTIKYSEELGLCCFIMELPEGYDPDEYIKTYGLSAYQKLFKSACKPSEWLAKEFLSKYLLNTKEGLERAKIALLEEAKQYKGLILEAFLEETTKELKQDKNYILELVKKQQQESEKGIALFTLKSFLPDAPVNEDFLIPIGWSLDNKGLIKIKETKDDILEIPIAAAPFFVSSRSVNIDTKQEKLELTYLRDKKWKTIYEERAILLDHRKIVQLAGLGFPVTSLNCKEIVHFISDFEGTNDEILPKRTTISGFGWKKEKNTQYFVMPEKAYGTNISIVFEPEGLGDGRLAKALRAEGNLKEWKIAVRRLIDHPRAMFHLYASLTPPLLELIDAPNFIIDNWGLTSIGKTTIISIAASIWGLPIKEQGGLIVGWDATKVSIERLACLFNHLPIFLDDSQTAKEKTIENILYMIANGVGRLRGALKGTQKTSHWRTVAFSTGEKALNTVTEYEGAKARIISLYGSPFGEKKEAELIHKIKPIINSNFGFAGPCFLSELINKSHNKSNELLRKEYRCYTAKLAKLGKDNVSDRIAQYLGAVQVAGRIAEDLFEIGGEPEKVIKHIFRESIGELKEAGDYPQRALELIISWVQSNQNSFDKSDFQADVDRGEVFGVIRHGEYIGLFPHKLKELLHKNKFSYSTIVKAFKDRNWIQTTKTDNTYPIGFRTKKVRMIKIHWKSFIDLWE